MRDPSLVEPAMTDRVLPYTRWLGVALLPFLAVAVVLLYGFPTRTATLFSWTIVPPLTARFLACAYLGGIWFFGRVALGHRWHAVQRGFPAVILFATLLGIATLLHWEKFHFGQITLITWATLYVTTPFLALAALLTNRRQDTGVFEPRDYPIPRGIRYLLVIIGACATISGLVLFVGAESFAASWAWTLTPLTARVIGSAFTLPGMVNIWMLVDPRWSSFRIVFQAQLVSLGAILLTLVLSGGDLLWNRAVTPVVVGGLIVSFVAYAAYYLYCERRARRVE